MYTIEYTRTYFPCSNKKRTTPEDLWNLLKIRVINITIMTNNVKAS